MVRSDLITMIARDFGLKRDYAERAVTTVFDEIVSGLTEGNRVELRGFGTFAVRQRRERKARNPRTGEPVDVSEKHVPVFATGKQLRDRLNGRE